MTTTNVPSDQFDDLKRDIEDATRYSNSNNVYFNRVGKQIRPIPLQEQDVAETLAAAEQALANSGFIPNGDFATGGTVEAKNEVFSDGADYWRYDGSLPFTVTAGSSPTPTGVGAWINVTDGTLRSQLAAVDSDTLVGGTEAKKVGELSANLYQKIELRETVNGTGESFIGNPDKGNNIASDLNSCFIATGGYFPDENLIGFTKPSESFAGDDSTKVFTTTFDATDAGDIRVELVRADGVRLGVTTKDATQIDIVGGKAQVTYPIDGHFVNNGTGGSEGTDAFLSPDETLIVSSTVANENIGSNANLCAIYGGYDNVIQQGIMQQVSGAHHRVKGGDHNTVIGGSYGVINQGSYGTIFGGTNNKILSVGNSSGSGVFGGTGNEVDNAVGWVFGGVSNSSSGSFSTCAGGLNNSASGNGAFVCGRDNTASGQDSFACSKENTASGVYSFASGFGNTVTAPYGVSFGRGNTVSAEYSSAFSFGGEAGGNSSSVFGVDPKTRFPGEQALGAGKNSVVGDAQSSVITLKNQTTSATATRLKPSDSSRLSLDSGECWAFNALIIGKRTDVTGESGGFRVSGIIDNSAGTASITGTPMVENIGDGASTWSASAVVGASNSLEIMVGGDSGKTVSWICRLEIAMVL